MSFEEVTKLLCLASQYSTIIAFRPNLHKNGFIQNVPGIDYNTYHSADFLFEFGFIKVIHHYSS